MPLRPLVSRTPARPRVCQAWLTVVGLTPRALASARTVGRRVPGANSPLVTRRLIEVATARDDPPSMRRASALAATVPEPPEPFMP